MKNFKLYLEFLFIYIIPPLVIIYLKEKYLLYLFLFFFCSIAFILLKKEKKKSLKEFFGKIEFKSLKFNLLFFIFAIHIYALMIGLNSFYSMPIENIKLWIIIIIFYPIISVFPQEIIYRVLFVERYKKLFVSKKDYSQIVNTFIFTYSHIVFQNHHAIIISAIASPIFYYQYTKKSFLNCFIIHSLGGYLIYTVGLGDFFFLNN